ncbi:MAG: TolC family protein, partial [Phycisphaerae bacterium]
ARALDDPMFTYGYVARQSDMQMNQMMGIMQTFPWLGTIEARTDTASARANAARKRFEAAKLKILQQVKDNFYEYTYLATATEIARENLELLTNFEEVARTKYKTAIASHPDIIRAQIELASIEDILKSLEQLREPMTAKINALLNRPASSELPWPAKEKLVQIHIERQQIIEMLINANPELAELDWQIEASKSEIELAKKKFYPNIGVGVEWTGFERSGESSGRDSIAIMFQMNIPLWRQSYKAAEQQAKAMARKIEYQKTDSENKIIAQTFNVLYEIDDSRRKFNLYGQTLIPKSQELVQASESAYRAGTIDFLSLIDSQRMLLQYKLDYERSITNYQQKIAELEMLIGKDLQNPTRFNN